MLALLLFYYQIVLLILTLTSVTHIDVIRYEEKAGGMEALHER